MGKLYNVTEVCEGALRRVQNTPLQETGADPAALRVAMVCLDKLLSEFYATEAPEWRQTGSVLIPIAAATNPIDLIAAAAGDIDADNFEIVSEAWLHRNDTNQDTPLDVIYRSDYAAVSPKTQVGLPNAVYIDRQTATPMIYFDSVLQVSGYSLGVNYYEQSPILTKTGAHRVAAAWQRYLDFQLSFDVGTGPVVWLSGERLKILKGVADEARGILSPRQNRETRTPTHVRHREF